MNRSKYTYMTVTYQQLEEQYRTLRQLEKDYFKLRYAYWQSLHKIKGQVTRKDGLTWKEFEGKVRRDAKKIRKTLLKSKPKGKYSLDHKFPVLRAFIEDWTVAQVNATENLQWLPSKENLWKGILTNN